MRDMVFGDIDQEKANITLEAGEHYLFFRINGRLEGKIGTEEEIRKLYARAITFADLISTSLVPQFKFIKKEDVPKLAAGKRYDEIENLPFEDIGQGYGFKSEAAFDAGDDLVCYIPEYCYDDETLELEPDSCYTKADFLELTGDEEEKARELFAAVDWQHPSSLWQEWDEEDSDEN